MEAQILTWMADIFCMFTLHILSEKLLGAKEQSRLLLVLGWSACFALWNAGSYLFMDHVFVSNVSTSIIYFLVLYFMYNGSGRDKVVLVLIAAALGMAAERIADFLMTLSGSFAGRCLNAQADSACVGNALSKLIWSALVKALTGLILEQRRMKAGRKDNELLKQQNEFFWLRYEEFEMQWLKMRRMRHDMANQCALEMGYLEKGEYGQLMQHYQEKLGQIRQQEQVIHTGNVGIDSVLNYKLGIARECGIEVHKKIKMESEVGISNVDLNILLGNLFDNAVEAVRNLSADKRTICFLLRTSAARLLFEIRNPYEGKRREDKNGNFLTSKRDPVYHGLGLGEVRDIVRKYDGSMDISAGEGEFVVKVFVYIGR